jgi:Carboxypeptidase regulatory-like domain
MSDMKSLRKGFAYVAAFLVCVQTPTLSLPQEPKFGQIAGHVADTTGAIIEGASVFVRRTEPPEGEVRLLTHTDMHGNFKLVLPEGGYDILIASSGFASGFKTLPVLAGKNRRVQWKLGALDCSSPAINCDPVTVH